MKWIRIETKEWWLIGNRNNGWMYPFEMEQWRGSVHVNRTMGMRLCLVPIRTVG